MAAVVQGSRLLQPQTVTTEVFILVFILVFSQVGSTETFMKWKKEIGNSSDISGFEGEKETLRRKSRRPRRRRHVEQSRLMLRNW
ncbi:unnamed protein product [Arctogadus glacialis]